MMKRSHRRILILIVLAALVAAAIFYATRPEPVRVRLGTVDRGSVEATVANTRAGTVEACRRARLAPAQGGQIAALPVHEGDAVKTGQVLLELWNEDLKAQLKLAQREANAAEAKAEQACVSAAVAQREADRLSKLRTKGLASEEATERAIGNAKAQQAACRAAQATTQVSEANVEVARAALERTRLRAPFDGTIAEVNGELGEFTTPSPVGIPTLPAVDLIDRSCLYVTAPIDEVDAPQIRRGMPVRISLDAFPKRTFSGQVRRIAPYVLDVEKQARTVDVEVDFSAPRDTEVLLPGYSADVEIILARRDEALRVPTEAVQDNNRVWVYRSGDGTLEVRTIEPGLSNWVVTEVVNGLREGDQVVTSAAQEALAPGVRVQPQNNAAR